MKLLTGILALSFSVIFLAGCGSPDSSTSNDYDSQPSSSPRSTQTPYQQASPFNANFGGKAATTTAAPMSEKESLVGQLITIKSLSSGKGVPIAINEAALREEAFVAASSDVKALQRLISSGKVYFADESSTARILSESGSGAYKYYLIQVLSGSADSRMGWIPMLYVRPNSEQSSLSSTAISQQVPLDAQLLNQRLFDLVEPIVATDAGEKENPMDTQTAAALIKNGADVNAWNNGETLLIRAARTGHIQVMGILLDHGADINAQDDRGETPLMLAAGANDPQMVKLLLSRKPKLTIKDKQGYTVWTGSQEANSSDPNYLSMRRLLKQAGAK